MKKLAFLSAVALSVALTYCGSKSDQSAGPGVIRTLLSNSSGDVRIERGSEALTAAPGLPLQASDVLVTGVDSTAELAIEGYGLVKVGAETRIQIQKISQDASSSSAEIKLERGNVASFVNRRSANQEYAVVTPTAIAGVRGTAFLVSVSKNADAHRVQVSVLDGQVAVNLPGQEAVVLEKNSQIAIDGFQAITRSMVRPLSRESLEEIKKLAVFHRNNITEFNTLLDEVSRITPELQILEGDATADSALGDRDSRSADRGGLDNVDRAARADVSRTVRRDTQGDPIKLQPQSSYTQQ